MTDSPKLSEIVRFSFTKTREIFFPFQLKRWMQCLLVVWLCGHTASLVWNAVIWPQPKTPVVSMFAPPPMPAYGIPAPGLDAALPESFIRMMQAPAGASPSQEALPLDLAQIQSTIQSLTSYLIPIFLALGFILAWLSSRFDFLLLAFLQQKKDFSIRSSFSQFKSLGNSYLLSSLVLFAGILVLSWLVSTGIEKISNAFFIVKPIGYFFLTLLSATSFLTASVGRDFVLPMMYRDQMNFVSACRKFVSTKPRISSLILYFISLLGLSFLAFLVMALLLAVAFLVLIFVSIITGFTVGFTGVLLPFLRDAMPFLSVLILIPFLVVVVHVLFMLLTPIPVFFRIFSLTYLNRLSPEYDLLGFQKR